MTRRTVGLTLPDNIWDWIDSFHKGINDQEEKDGEKKSSFNENLSYIIEYEILDKSELEDRIDDIRKAIEKLDGVKSIQKDLQDKVLSLEEEITGPTK